MDTMVSLDAYRTMIGAHGRTLGEVKRNQSDMIINETFEFDPAYKRVYILARDGWKFEDAKYQVHTAQSIVRDTVDIHLQFRPKVHYPIGTYVIVPDDTDADLNLEGDEWENPFLQPVKKRTQWWLIIGRDNAPDFVRYSILPCDYNFRWIRNGKIMECFGIVRSANSYTSGAWRADYSQTLDNLTQMWLPNTYYTYGSRIHEFGLCDTRTINYEQRFFLTNNALNPKIYTVTKIVEMNPPGILKYSIKQDELDLERDNPDLQICNYYSGTGKAQTAVPPPEKEPHPCTIQRMELDPDGMLVPYGGDMPNVIRIAETAYFRIRCEGEPGSFTWRLHADDPAGNQACSRIKLETLDDTTAAIRPGRSNLLLNQEVDLTADDRNELYTSATVALEVRGCSGT